MLRPVHMNMIEHVTDSQYLDLMTQIHQADFIISEIQVGKNNKHIYFCS